MKFLSKFFYFSLRRPRMTVVFYLIVSVLCGYLVRGIVIDTDIANLLPSDNPHVKAMHTLTERLGGEDGFEVIIFSEDGVVDVGSRGGFGNAAKTGDNVDYSGSSGSSGSSDKVSDKNDIEKSDTRNYRIKSEILDVADSVISRLMSLERGGQPMINRSELRNDVSVLRENLLYFFTVSELDELSELIAEVRSLQLRRANPFFVDFEDDSDEDSSKSEGFGRYIHQNESALPVQIPPEYRINADSTALMIRFFPSGSKSEIGFLQDLIAGVDRVVNEIQTELNTSQNINIYYGGNLKNHLTKFEDISLTLQFAVVFGVIGILGFLLGYVVYLSFRYIPIVSVQNINKELFRRVVWSFGAVALIFAPLVVSLLFTYATGFLLFAELNIMTTVLVAILLGVNLDYILHYFSSFMRYRSVQSFARAITSTYFDCGKALLISGLTSGLAMLVLLFSEFRGFFEFGALFFLGIVSTFFITITLFSALLVFFDKAFVRAQTSSKTLSVRGPANSETLHQVSKSTPISFIETPAAKDEKTNMLSGLFPQTSAGHLRTGVIFSIVLILGICLNSSRSIEFEYAFNELEPPIPSSVFNNLYDTFERPGRGDPAFFLFDSRSDAILAAEILSDSIAFPTIGFIESLHDRFPFSARESDQKLQKIAEIRAQIEDPLVQDAIQQIDENHADLLDVLTKSARQSDPLDLDQIPEFLKNRFTGRDGEIANLVIINPNMMLADGRASLLFKQDAGSVTIPSDNRTYYAASTSIIAASILEIMQREAFWLMFMPLTFALVCLLLFFKSWRWGLLSFAPLLAGMILLVGLMSAFGLKFNIYNMIVLPAVLGVGADNGIHLFHRIRLMREERIIQMKRATSGSANIGFSISDVFTSTGIFVTASSVTTSLGFAGLIFTNHPGLQSMGIVAVGGIMLTLLCGLLFAAVYGMFTKYKVR